MNKRNPKIAIVMAVYSPNPRYFVEQIQSIFDQTYSNWHLFIFLDGSTEISIRNQSVAKLGSLIPLKFKKRVTIASGNRVGSYWNFERGLALSVQSNADLFCFADQDDIWLSNKIFLQVQTLNRTKASLVHSDLIAVNEFGEIVSNSVWKDEGRIYPITQGLLFSRNMITGCTMLFTRDLAESSLPFPPQLKPDGTYWHHDYWIAMLASVQSVKRIVGISETLVKYRKHGENQIGYTPGVYYPRNLKQAIFDYRLRKSLLSKARFRDRERQQVGKVSYPSDFRLFVLTLTNAFRFYSIRQTRLSLLLSIANVISQIEKSLTAVRRLQKVLSIGLKKGFIFLRIYLRTSKSESDIFGEKSAKFSIVTSDKKESELLILVPTLQASSLFGGISTILNFAIEAVVQGKSVKIVCTDIPIQGDQNRIKKHIVAELKLKKWPSKLSIGSIEDLLTLGKSDVLMATAWWTKPICEKIRDAAQLDIPIVYFIQDFEPLFYAASENYLDALKTYKECSYSIVNTKLLGEYLKVYAPSVMKNYSILAPQLIQSSFVRPAISEPNVLNIFFYSRPSVPRNLYNLGVESLQKFLLTIPRATRVNIHFAGESMVSMPAMEGAYKIYSHGKLSRSDYSELLQSIDIGLCLMASPHPSYPTLELAIHGAQSVTNSFGKFKSSKNLAGITVAEPEVDDLVNGLEIAYKNCLNSNTPRNLDFSELGSELKIVVKEMYKFLNRK
jgi:glycosyltransferase involved in cell wall biosynthesis